MEKNSRLCETHSHTHMHSHTHAHAHAHAQVSSLLCPTAEGWVQVNHFFDGLFFCYRMTKDSTVFNAIINYIAILPKVKRVIFSLTHKFIWRIYF